MKKEKNYLPIYDKVLSNLPRIFGYDDIFNSDIMVICAIIATLKKRNSAFISLTYSELIQLTSLNQHTIKRSLSKIRKDYMDVSLRRPTGDNRSWCIWIELTQGKTYDVYLDIINNYKVKFSISKEVLNSNLTVNEKLVLGYIYNYTKTNRDFYLNGKTITSELRMSELGLEKIYKKLERLGLISSSTKLPRKKGLVQKIYRKANPENITKYYKDYTEYVQKIDKVETISTIETNNKINKVDKIENVENSNNIQNVENVDVVNNVETIDAIKTNNSTIENVENNNNIQNIENNSNIETNNNIETIYNIENINSIDKVDKAENIIINVFALNLSKKFINSLSKEQLNLLDNFINSLSKEQLHELLNSAKQYYENLHNKL